jgi:hypothetical protein
MAQHFRAPDTRRMIWDKFPHLLFVATRPGSGKTTAMRAAGYLCAPYYFGIDNNATAPGLCFTIAQERAVVCIDEAHRLIGPKGTRKADVVTIMCSSFERDGTYLNGRGGKANRVPVYSPMMIAAKEDPFLTSAGEEIADVIERSHLIMMSKPPEGTELAEVTDETRAHGALIAEKMAQWAAEQMASREQFSEAVRAARAAAAAIGLNGRDRDVWLAQFTVAALCSPGHLKAACDAALELRRNQPAPPDEDEADPLADLEASLAVGGRLSSWGLAAGRDEGPAGAGGDWSAEEEAGIEPAADEPTWNWDEDSAWETGEEGDAGVPLTPAPPAQQPVTYRAVMTVQGQGTRLLAGRIADPAFARRVCEETPEAKALYARTGQPLQWAERRPGVEMAGNTSIAWAVAEEKSTARVS